MVNIVIQGADLKFEVSEELIPEMLDWIRNNHSGWVRIEKVD